MSLTDGAMVLKHNWLSGGVSRKPYGGEQSSSSRNWGTFSSRKSAVELLQETKGRYVKSDSVLENVQHPDRPDHLKISAPPCTFPPPRPQVHIESPQNAPPVVEPLTSPKVNVVPLTSDALAKYIGGITPQPVVTPRISRTSMKPRLRPRAKTQPVNCLGLQKGTDLRRSVSHGPSDLQSKLRRLLNAESRENICPVNLKYETEVETKNDVKTHKSLPNLNHALDQGNNGEINKRRPSCPERIFQQSRKPPPVPPRPKKPIVKPPSPPPRGKPRTPPPRPPPPKGLYFSKSTPSMPTSCFKGENLVSIFKGSQSDGGKKAIDVDVIKLTNLSDEESPVNDDCSKKPVVRSKSDITYVRNHSESSPEPMNYNHSEEDTRLFFEYLGLGGSSSDFKSSPCGTPPTYFDRTPSSGSSLRRNSSDSGEHTPQNMNRKSIEPSIIEKNARIIKWLFQMQKARSQQTNKSS